MFLGLYFRMPAVFPPLRIGKDKVAGNNPLIEHDGALEFPPRAVDGLAEVPVAGKRVCVVGALQGFEKIAHERTLRHFVGVQKKYPRMLGRLGAREARGVVPVARRPLRIPWLYDDPHTSGFERAQCGEVFRQAGEEMVESGDDDVVGEKSRLCDGVADKRRVYRAIIDDDRDHSAAQYKRIWRRNKGFAPISPSIYCRDGGI